MLRRLHATRDACYGAEAACLALHTLVWMHDFESLKNELAQVWTTYHMILEQHPACKEWWLRAQGFLAHYTGDYLKAAAILQQTADFCHRHDLGEALETALHFLGGAYAEAANGNGTSYNEHGLETKALRAFKDSWAIANKIGNDHRRANNMLSIARLLLSHPQLKDPLLTDPQSLRAQAFEIAKDMGIGGLVRFYFANAEYYYQLGMKRQGDVYLEHAASHWLDIRYPKGLSDILSVKAEQYAYTYSRYEEALEFYIASICLYPYPVLANRNHLRLQNIIYLIKEGKVDVNGVFGTVATRIHIREGYHNAVDATRQMETLDMVRTMLHVH